MAAATYLSPEICSSHAKKIVTRLVGVAFPQNIAQAFLVVTAFFAVLICLIALFIVSAPFISLRLILVHV